MKRMMNQMVLDTLYHSMYDEDNALEHHGVEGQSWGDRNGPPYPLQGVDKKVARAEYKAKKEKPEGDQPAPVTVKTGFKFE